MSKKNRLNSLHCFEFRALNFEFILVSHFSVQSLNLKCRLYGCLL
jgi:hypothetical protein